MSTATVTTELVIEFDRIGRDRNVPPLVLSGMQVRTVAEMDLNDIAKAVHEYAQPKLRSREIEVEVNPVMGTVYSGEHVAGSFTLVVSEVRA
jgi:hypothetical protein